MAHLVGFLLWRRSRYEGLAVNRRRRRRGRITLLLLFHHLNA